MRKMTLSLAVLLCLCFISYAQEAKIPVAVFPFTYSTPENKARASQIQDIVVEILKAKSTINLIDRSKDSLLLKELIVQTREESVSATGLVQQGKISGAKQLLAGTVTNVQVEQKTNNNPANVLTKKPTVTTTYVASVSFSLQLMDVESGATVSQKTFDSNDPSAKFLGIINTSTATTREEAIFTAINSTKKAILVWINKSYPPVVKILSIESRTGKGLPETILVSGIDASLPKGTKLDVNEVQQLDAGDGKMLNRTRKIAALRIKEFQGDFTLCQVIDGASTLEEKTKPPAKISIVAR